MEEKKHQYRVSICEVSYEDRYEEGEVFGTCQLCDIETNVVTDIKKAIEDFAKIYSRDEKVFFDDGFFHTDEMSMPDDYGWRRPSDSEVEAWKAGKISLYNVEYQLHIHELVDVPEETLEEVAKDIIKES